MNNGKNTGKARFRGFSLLELIIGVSLIGMLAVGAAMLAKVTAIGSVNSNLRADATMADAKFADALVREVKKSTLAFTVPEASFTRDKLTEDWNYIGLMNDVHIPAACSFTGREIDHARALVYIEYAGKDKPLFVPSDCNAITNLEGSWFIQKIISHDYTDMLGRKYEYSLVFEPTDAATDEGTAVQTINYRLKCNIIDANGKEVSGNSDTIDLDAVLGSPNAVQIVYRGSSNNPATAVAFCSADSNGGITSTRTVTTVTETHTATGSEERVSISDNNATVVVLFEDSADMTRDYGDYQYSNGAWHYPYYPEDNNPFTKALDAVYGMVDELSQYDNVYLLFIPFNSRAETGWFPLTDDDIEILKEEYGWSEAVTGYPTKVNGTWRWRNSYQRTCEWFGHCEYQQLYNTAEEKDKIYERLSYLTGEPVGQNTGDAFRYAYWALKNKIEKENFDPGSVYTMLIYSGETSEFTTYASIMSKFWSEYPKYTLFHDEGEIAYAMLNDYKYSFGVEYYAEMNDTHYNKNVDKSLYWHKGHIYAEECIKRYKDLLEEKKRNNKVVDYKMYIMPMRDYFYLDEETLPQLFDAQIDADELGRMFGGITGRDYTYSHDETQTGTETTTVTIEEVTQEIINDLIVKRGPRL